MRRFRTLFVIGVYLFQVGKTQKDEARTGKGDGPEFYINEKWNEFQLFPISPPCSPNENDLERIDSIYINWVINSNEKINVTWIHTVSGGKEVAGYVIRTTLNTEENCQGIEHKNSFIGRTTFQLNDVSLPKFDCLSVFPIFYKQSEKRISAQGNSIKDLKSTELKVDYNDVNSILRISVNNCFRSSYSLYLQLFKSQEPTCKCKSAACFSLLWSHFIDIKKKEWFFNQSNDTKDYFCIKLFARTDENDKFITSTQFNLTKTTKFQVTDCVHQHKDNWDVQYVMSPNSYFGIDALLNFGCPEEFEVHLFEVSSGSKCDHIYSSLQFHSCVHAYKKSRLEDLTSNMHAYFTNLSSGNYCAQFKPRSQDFFLIYKNYVSSSEIVHVQSDYEVAPVIKNEPKLSNKISSMTIIGIVVGLIVVLGISFIIGVKFYKSYRKKDVEISQSEMNSLRPGVLLKTERFTRGPKKIVYLISIVGTTEMTVAVNCFIDVLENLLYCEVVRINYDYTCDWSHQTGKSPNQWSLAYLPTKDNIFIVQPDIVIKNYDREDLEEDKFIFLSCLHYLSCMDVDGLCCKTSIIRFDGFAPQNLFSNPSVTIKEFVIPIFLGDLCNLLHSTHINEEEFQVDFRQEIDQLKNAIFCCLSRISNENANNLEEVV